MQNPQIPNAELLIIKATGTYSYHSASRGLDNMLAVHNLHLAFGFMPVSSEPLAHMELDYKHACRIHMNQPSSLN
jgi:hypothetical protein